jgi:hypothetical protein
VQRPLAKLPALGQGKRDTAEGRTHGAKRLGHISGMPFASVWGAKKQKGQQIIMQGLTLRCRPEKVSCLKFLVFCLAIV